ncbi:MAG: DUF1598 domain-containing protein [Planctomycetia bacterium]|nr:DUF1598 domain-containing protein [Planctomycetia bacterium]
MSYKLKYVAFAVLGLVLILGDGAFSQDTDVNNYAGIVIDANNVLRVQTYVEPSLQTLRARQMESARSLPKELREYTPARAVSLTRLEREIAKNNGLVPEEVRYMAGLQKIDSVLVYPETGDVVLVGPAEGWYKDVSGRVVGLTTGRPVLRLDDLVAAMRVFAPSGEASVIGCSIDPTQEGLAAMQQFLRQVGTTARPGDTMRIVNGLRNALGLQEVRVDGVSSRTHFAQVLVEADYRMKLMGIGLEAIPVKGMKSFVASASPAAVSRNALFRWYFVPNYTCVRVSPDGLAMGLEGQGVKLVGADELVTTEGERKATAGADRASKVFTQGFTTHYEKIAASIPVYAELRNLIDMAVVAAWLQQTDVYGKLDWKMVYFGDERRFPIETERAPSRVASAVNAIWKGHTLMTPIGGGVEIHAARALRQENLVSAADEKLAEAKKSATLPKKVWWWQ